MTSTVERATTYPNVAVPTAHAVAAAILSTLGLPLVAFEDEAGVLPAEAEAVLEHDIDVGAAGLVRHVAEVPVGVRVLVVARRVEPAGPAGLPGRDAIN